jgi:hypothetical protein
VPLGRTGGTRAEDSAARPQSAPAAPLARTRTADAPSAPGGANQDVPVGGVKGRRRRRHHGEAFVCRLMRLVEAGNQQDIIVHEALLEAGLIRNLGA